MFTCFTSIVADLRSDENALANLIEYNFIKLVSYHSIRFLYKLINFLIFLILTINTNVYKTNKKIKLNNLYLDNTKHIPMYTTSVGRIQSSINVSIPDSDRNIYHVQDREKRRIRKLYLDNKKEV
uniref:Uncharacterized protein n=1 Tax=Lactuca sativa TaxID=4236 RepID=A0A9R1XHL8_LACSA|nr:hypothetical protein LSAT_V11C400219430 [Lactuca sativa]